MALDQNLQGEVAATAKADKSAGFVRRVLGAFGGPTIGLIVMCIALTFISEYFFTADNLSNVLNQISDVGIMAAGATLVILIAGIDLSVAGNMALTMMFTAWLYAEKQWPFVITLERARLLRP